MLNKNFASLKVINFIIGGVGGFCQLYCLRYATQNIEESIFLLALGVVNFAVLFDFGFGRVFYTKIRRSYLMGNVQSLSIGCTSSMLFFFSMFIIILLICSVSFFCIHKFFFSENLHILISISLFVSLNCFITFYRDLFEAINQHIHFEFVELTRRLIIYIFPFPFVYFGGLNAYYYICAFFLSLIAIIIVKFYIKKTNIIVFPLGKRLTISYLFIKKIAVDVRMNFLYKLCDVVSYNWGVIFFSGQAFTKELLFFSIWSRIFVGISIPARIYIDSCLPKISEMWLSGNSRNLKGIRAAIFGIVRNSLLIVTLPISILFFLGDDIFKFYHSSGYDGVVFLCLFFWCVINPFIHVAGSYKLSFGLEIKQLSYTALIYTLILMSVVFIMIHSEMPSSIFDILRMLTPLYILYSLIQFKGFIESIRRSQYL